MRQPDGSSTVLTTKLDAVLGWVRKNSLWPIPFGTACCAIEFMSTVSSHYDLARFGAEVVRFSPRQSDLMIVAGTITDKMAPVVKRIYEQMAEPKYVISMGACACTGGFYRAYHVVQASTSSFRSTSTSQAVPHPGGADSRHPAPPGDDPARRDPQ